MRYFYIALLCLVFSASFGQTQRAFITKDGSYSADSANAVSYVLIQKMSVDSAYAVKQYDMHDTIMSSGIYKDVLLKIPNGKFIYYAKNKYSKEFHENFPSLSNDTLNYVSNVGYYVNGKRQGIWLHYSSRGEILQRSTYENDKINGPFTAYYGQHFRDWTEGTMVNNQMEGKFYIYTADSLLVAELDYVHNKEVKQINHLVKATAPGNFSHYMEKALSKFKPQLIANVPEVRFVITKTGTIKDVQMIKGIAPDVDAAFILALTQAPSFKPGLYDGVPFDEKVSEDIVLFKGYRKTE